MRPSPKHTTRRVTELVRAVVALRLRPGSREREPSKTRSHGAMHLPRSVATFKIHGGRTQFMALSGQPCPRLARVDGDGRLVEEARA
jgi:hypothetical protein